MQDIEYAKLMLSIAGRELRALEALKDSRTVAAEIFGYHVHQAAEKSLKAWLSLSGLAFPRIHDLERLFGMLIEHGEQVPESFRDLEIFTEFTVQFRYEYSLGFENEPERVPVIFTVGKLVSHVEQLLQRAEAPAN